MNDAISRISAMESLIELYRDPCSKKAVLIRTVPTLSHRRTSATKCLNELLQERPDMANTVYALLTYPVQKWAQKVRKSIGIDAQMNDALENSFLDTVRVTKELCSSSDVQPRIGDNRAVRLAESDAIIGVIEEAVQWLSETPSIGGKLAHAVRAIHFMDQDAEDLSANEFRKYYRPAIIYLHDRYCDDIDRNVCQMTSSGWLYSGNTYSEAYHNTVLLVSIYSYLLHRYERRSHTGLSDQSIQRDADGLMLLKNI